MSQFDNNFIICEIAQKKIYRVYEDLSTSIFFISKRTNQLYFYETIDERKVQKELSIQKKSSTRFFNSFEEIQPGLIVDVRDNQNKWYVAIITGKESVLQISRVRIHFYHLNENWDEWIEESESNLLRLRPLNSTGRAQQPEYQIISLSITQRRINDELDQESKISIGIPYFYNVPNWFSWQQLAVDITNQIIRHLRHPQSNLQNFEEVSDELNEVGARVFDRNEKNANKSSTVDKTFSAAQIPTASFKRPLQPFQHIQNRDGVTSKDSSKLSKWKQSGQLDTILEKPMQQSFKIKLFCGETQKCAFCIMKQRYNQEHEICTSGCAIPQTNDEIKWITCLFKKLDVYIDWIDQNGESTYKEADVHRDISYIRLKKLESESITGVPLGSCLDLYSKKEKIDGYQCDHCKSSTQALLKPLISHLPDILILHLKRFNFDGGYLDKIEDLVTFPLKNLDMQKYVVDGMKQSTTYDLYAVVNHHIYQTGGHYTAAVQVKTQSEPIWVLTNDSSINQLANPITEIVKKDAYLLFYKRRELTPSNLLTLGDVL